MAKGLPKSYYIRKGLPIPSSSSSTKKSSSSSSSSKSSSSPANQAVDLQTGELLPDIYKQYVPENLKDVDVEKVRASSSKTAVEQAQAQARANLAPATPQKLAGQQQTGLPPSDVRAATPSEKFGMTAAGVHLEKLWQGLIGSDPGGQLSSMPPTEILAYLAGYVGNKLPLGKGLTGGTATTAISSADDLAYQQMLDKGFDISKVADDALGQMAAEEQFLKEAVHPGAIKPQGYYDDIVNWASQFLDETAVSKAATVGKLETFNAATGTAGTFATNTATQVTTASWLSKIITGAKAVGKNPIFIVSALMSIIGSYPFAGFIREEALQTLGFSQSTALKDGNLKGYDEAAQLRDEILDPGLWNSIKSGIPFVNILDKLNDFYDAAQIQGKVYDKIADDLRNNPNENEDERWERIKQEQLDQEQNLIDYYNSERKKLIEWEAAAEAAQRKEEAAFWAAERKKQSKAEEADRKAIADFWFQYRKRLQELYEDNRPSNLNFGLL